MLNLLTAASQPRRMLLYSSPASKSALASLGLSHTRVTRERISGVG